MKILIALGFIFTGALSEGTSHAYFLKDLKPEQRILGGQLAASGQFPYQAALIMSDGSNSWFCGGSIISDRWILTAAHCPDGATIVRVILGSNDINNIDSNAQQYLVKDKQNMIIHEKYNRNNLNNDLALVKLPSTIQFNSKVKKISLPKRSSNPPSYENVIATASGWGKTKDSDPSVTNELRFVSLKVIRNQECNRSYAPGFVVSSTLCVSTRGKKSICSGDSGGPLVVGGVQGTLVGVSSFVSNSGCGSEVPAGFSRVTSYLQWIKDNTGLDV
ncbi:hypothetical protein ACFFRR_002303 [Megaselia abdita]